MKFNSFLTTLAVAGFVIVASTALMGQGVGNGSNMPFGATYSAGIGTTAVVVKNSPGTFFGLSNAANLVQVAATNCFDNASAASGTLLPGSGIVIAAAGSTFPNTPSMGVKFVNGLTCITPVTVVGSGPVALFN